jgi:hypothetical protein
MKIPNRLKLIWWAVWHGYVPYTITRIGADQTKGYKQRWKLWLHKPYQNTLVVTADDMIRAGEPTGMHYDAMLADDIESTPVDPDIIDAVRDSPADPNDPDGPTLREVMPPGSFHYLPHEKMTREDRDAVILKDWKARNPK